MLRRRIPSLLKSPWNFQLGPQEPRQHKCSLRSKRFQSSYCAKVSFFGSCPSFLDEPREETLATQASTNVKGFN